MEIRTLEESFDELAGFVNTIWRNDYAGRMTVPLWTPEYFAWQLSEGDGPDRRHVLGAYDGSKLVGMIAGVPHEFRVNQTDGSGIISSWLTVAPSWRGRSLVPQLKEEQERRVREAGGRFIVSYRYHGTRHSLADRPARPRETEADTDVRRVGVWARVLDPQRAADWYLSSFDRWATRVGYPVLRSLRANVKRAEIRPVEEQDLDECLALAENACSEAVVQLRWTRERLKRHLVGGPCGHGLVYQRDGVTLGWMSYHDLPFLGRTEQPVSIIDFLILHRMRHRERRGFLLEGLLRMREQGSILALKMGFGDVAIPALVDSGFVPQPRDSLQVVRRLDQRGMVSLRGKQMILWR